MFLVIAANYQIGRERQVGVGREGHTQNGGFVGLQDDRTCDINSKDA